MVAGSEVPNLLEAGAASTLVVSQDVDLLVPVAVHGEVKARLASITRLVPSRDEPSVWVPRAEQPDLIEVNFIGADPAIVDPIDTYEREDERLPLLVFGPLSLLEPGPPVIVDGLTIPVPRASGLALEKLVTDRTGEKGDRDLLVVAGLLVLMNAVDLDELARRYRDLPPEMRDMARSNLSILAGHARPTTASLRDRRAARASGGAMTRARRVQQIRARARVRRWEFRQRHLARGAWQRFRIALATACDAYAIDDATVEELAAEGFARDDRGSGLEPPRRIVWITPERAARLRDARPLALRLDATMLAASALALVPFPGREPHSTGGGGAKPRTPA